MSVNATSNKELLFELLSSVIDENNFLIDIITLQQFIDNQCNSFEKNKQNYSGLSEINKYILDNCYKFLLENQLKQTQTLSVVDDNDLFNKSNKFDKNFKMMKENFDSMITLKKPEEINFEDDEDDAMPPENLETIMNQTLADREKELKNITQKYSDENKKKAEDWINKDSLKQTESTINITENQDIKDIKPKKKVSFEEPIESFNLFKKLKKKSEANPKSIRNLEEKVDKLITIQDIVLKQQMKILEILSQNSLENTNEKIKQAGDNDKKSKSDD